MEGPQQQSGSLENMCFLPGPEGGSDTPPEVKQADFVKSFCIITHLPTLLITPLFGLYKYYFCALFD